MKINIDVSDIVKAIASLGTAGQWLPPIINRQAIPLGRVLTGVMKDVVMPHRFTGILEGSISFDYDSSRFRIEIGPTAKRGAYDAGLILEEGTGPIPNLPIRRIAPWAVFRGANARAVTLSIRGSGVSAHPFLDDTVRSGRFGDEMEKAAEAMADAISKKALGI